MRAFTVRDMKFPDWLRSLFLWPFVLLAALFVHATSLAPGHEWGADYAWNWAQAISLIDGTAEEIARTGDWRVENMPNQISGPPVYPWGYPLVLAGGQLVWGQSLTAMKLYTLGFYLAGFAVFALIVRRRIDAFGAVALIAILAFLPSFFIEKNHIRSEAPFLLFLMMTTLALCDIYDKGARSSAWKLGVLGLLIFAAYWMRTHGITLLVALAIIQTARRRFDLAPYMVFAICWLAVQAFPGTSSYFGSGHADGLIDAPFETVLRNAVYYLYTPGALFDAPKVARPFIGLAFYGLVVLGAWRRRYADFVILVVCITYIALLVPYPFRQGRFLFPVIPFLLYFAYHGLTWAPAQRVVSGATAALCIAVTIVKWTSERPPIEGPYSAEAKTLWQYVETTPPDTVFLFWKPRSLTFYGGRRAIMRSDTPCPATHVVLYRNDEDGTAAKRNGQLASFATGEPIFENSKFSLYKSTIECQS